MLFAVVSVLAASTASAQDFLKMDLEALPAQADPNESPFMVGIATGYMKGGDSDDGGGYIGLMARLRIMPFLGIEALGAYHEQEFHDAVELVQHPVQASLLVFPYTLPDILHPYLLAGAGWYPTDFEYSGGLEDDEDTLSGFHVGGGAEFQLGTSFVATFDVRWIFMDDPDIANSALAEEDFDTLQVALGFALQF